MRGDAPASVYDAAWVAFAGAPEPTLAEDVSRLESLRGTLEVVRAATADPVSGGFVLVSADSVTGSFDTTKILGASFGASSAVRPSPAGRCGSS